jgi:ATP-dependent Clp protease ATP-binding subunit ClpX
LRTISLEGPLLTPRAIYERLDRYVIGQERAKRAVAIAAYHHEQRLASRTARGRPLLRKSNVLLIGPTGSGKTHLAQNLAEILEVPFVVADATEYTEAGYYGKDVEVMIGELLQKANGAAEEARRGIVFLDEVDKIARRSHGARTGAGARDIGGEGVQQALLKLLEGREVFVPLDVTQHWSKHDFVRIDTADILFICAGTFSDLHAYAGDRAVGFGRAEGAPRARPIGQKQLLEYGMLAEFLGRLPVVVQLEPLGPDELYRILTVPPDSIVREFRERCAADGVELHLTEGALRAIVGFAHERGLGARALRGIVEEALAEVLFLAPERRGQKWSVDARYVVGRLRALEPGRLGEGRA